MRKRIAEIVENLFSIYVATKDDWKALGVDLQFYKDKHGFPNVSAYWKGYEVGYAKFTFPLIPNEHETNLEPDGKHLQGWDLWVHPDLRRKGLGTAMYALAEKETGKKILPGGTTPEGTSFWHQPNRPFGPKHLVFSNYS